LPTVFGACTTALALINSILSRSSASFLNSSASFSLSIRSASFSFFFSSPTSIDASLFPLSFANWLQRIVYSSSDIFVFGLASIKMLYSLRKSTALSREIFNSLKTLLILIFFSSDI